MMNASISIKGRRITVHEAQISTASVEIKTLIIKGKQVTLAVFRQLQDEQVIDVETAQLNGVPWGTVNYHGSHCITAWNHFHVVWQKETELRRAEITVRWPRTDSANEELRSSRSYLTLLLKLIFLQRKLKGMLVPVENGYKIELHGQSIVRKWEKDAEMRGILNGALDAQRVEWTIEKLRRDEDIREDPQRLEEIAIELAERIACNEKRFPEQARAWEKQAKTLLELDQLFIAV